MNRRDYQRDYQKSYQARTKRVNLVFSDSEYRSVSRRAVSSGEAVAAYVKRCALAAHHHELTASVPEEIAGQLADLERVIRTIANNVNQMARHSHRIGHVLDEQEVFLHIAQLQSELKTAINRAASGAGRDADPSGEDTP